MASTPKWATQLVKDALDWWEAQGNPRPVFKIMWKRGRWSASGTAYFSYIAVRVMPGLPRFKAKLTLLHEVAHELTPGEGHGSKFWDVAWALYRWAKLPIRYVKVNEGSYRRGALVAYRRNLEARTAKRVAESDVCICRSRRGEYHWTGAQLLHVACGKEARASNS